jgi:SAM-dependent methyltransferase
MPEWHEDDGFWRAVKARIFGEPMRSDAGAEAADIVRLLGIEPPASILDMPCGVGRHAIELAGRGFRVTGVDRTPSYLADAAERARTEGLAERTEWVEADMRGFSRPEAFDAAINVYTSFGYFRDPEDDRRVAEVLLASLHPGGRVLLEMVNKSWIARRFRASDWHEEPDGTLVLEQRSLSADGAWIDNRWLIIRGAERMEMRFGHRLYGADELVTLLERCGFRGVEVYGALSGVRATVDSPRLVVVAGKG